MVLALKRPNELPSKLRAVLHSEALSVARMLPPRVTTLGCSWAVGMPSTRAKAMAQSPAVESKAFQHTTFPTSRPCRKHVSANGQPPHVPSAPHIRKSWLRPTLTLRHGGFNEITMCNLTRFEVPYRNSCRFLHFCKFSVKPNLQTSWSR